MSWKPQLLPYPQDFETKAVLKKLASVNRALAELKGLAQTMPQQDILINTLAIQEAKDSSEVENIVTTHDEIYKSTITEDKFLSPATKEVKNYVEALKKGAAIVKSKKILSVNDIIKIQEVLENNKAGLRKLPGTTLKNDKTGEVVFQPPQDAEVIKGLMQNLELYINDASLNDYDPVLKMAIIHFQFESIHPFYDGNGRTGRIINILYLLLQDLLDIPILYLSRYIIANKHAYYKKLQDVRDHNNWEAWILFMLEGVEETAYQTIDKVKLIKITMQDMKTVLRTNYKFYSHDLINHLFKQPYTKIEFLKDELHVSRVTAANYLNTLADDGVLIKMKQGKFNYYINYRLVKLFTK
ncbi:Fic family protein [Formosa maritima]|uniref:Fic family protein n=1 Tax=Formosa maritima TaxID=2592046 RepID=A0A5D0GD01_9FLAO|nr:Fic family protein [Formosa maritima]TYA55707.1 Fic family protein [Formosa maritima]